MPNPPNIQPTHENVEPQSENDVPKQRQRTFISEADKLILARLCVLWQDKYNDKGKGDFWNRIHAEFQKETGIMEIRCIDDS